MSRPASSSIVSRTRFAAAGRVGSIELLGARLGFGVPQDARQDDTEKQPEKCSNDWEGGAIGKSFPDASPMAPFPDLAIRGQCVRDAEAGFEHRVPYL